MNLKNLLSKRQVKATCSRLRKKRKKIVFTNGVFDIIHRGHVEYLTKAKTMGDVLIVGLNSDASVKRLKGKSTPLQSQNDRAVILLAFESVDYVAVFGEDTPLNLIKMIEPDVLVKGADYKISQIVGADFVKENGGLVKKIRLTKGKSTSKIVRKLP